MPTTQNNFYIGLIIVLLLIFTQFYYTTYKADKAATLELEAERAKVKSNKLNNLAELAIVQDNLAAAKLDKLAAQSSRNSSNKEYNNEIALLKQNSERASQAANKAKENANKAANARKSAENRAVINRAAAENKAVANRASAENKAVANRAAAENKAAAKRNVASKIYSNKVTKDKQNVAVKAFKENSERTKKNVWRKGGLGSNSTLMHTLNVDGKYPKDLNQCVDYAKKEKYDIISAFDKEGKPVCLFYNITKKMDGDKTIYTPTLGNISSGQVIDPETSNYDGKLHYATGTGMPCSIL
jgi:DNA polymerase III gamma/tau subunit